MRVNAYRFVVLGAVLLAVICAGGQAENGNHALGDGSGSINGRKSICPVPAFSISPNWSFPENWSAQLQ